LNESTIHGVDEERVAGELARELDELAVGSAFVAAGGFVDRVMAAIAAEPLPQPARAFAAALLGGRLRAAAASVADSWRVVVGGSAPRVVRAQAFALVLVVAIASLAVASGVAVGASDLLGNQPQLPAPTTHVPSNAAPIASPSPSAEPISAPERSTPPSPTTQATETPQRSQEPVATERPRTTERPAATGEQGDGSGGGGSGEGGDSGDGSHSPSPAVTETDDPAASAGGDG